MGWARGSELFSAIISAAKVAIPNDKTRRTFYVKIWCAFDDMDWDTEYECLGEDPMYDEIYKERFGDDD